MKHYSFVPLVLLVAGLAVMTQAGPMQRIGHTTLTPRHNIPFTNDLGVLVTNADDKGMYAAVIDPNNGYAYFFGNYLFKLDITGNLPVQVGTNIYGTNVQTGQFIEGAIDPALGYLYMPRAGGTIYRYALGTGNNPPSSASSLALGGSGATSIVVDDSDPNPANHCGYVLCSGTPARVVKVDLASFTQVSSTNLNAGENNFAWGQIDKLNGYAYFASYVVYTAPAIPQVLKIKLTPGANPPIRIGTTNLGAVPVPLWTSSIDTAHGYAYYATDNGTTNVPETLFKVKLGDGDTLPTPVPFGGVSLRTNEVQIISQVADPANGFVYLGDDNTYPGRIYQFSMNGMNAPIELGYLQLPGGAAAPPPDGLTTNNVTTNSDGILPFGEVMLRSAVFDPVRRFAYFGQDSRPNQVVKVQLAQIDPFTLTGAQTLNHGSFQFGFTNIPGAVFGVLATTNLALPLSNWTVLCSLTDSPPGQFQFTDPQATNGGSRFYRARSQ
jgi:hypothetical protein